MLKLPEAIEERTGIDPQALPGELLHPSQPYVLRGLAADWPMVKAARASGREAIGYLEAFACNPQPVNAMLAPQGAGGHISYADDAGLGFGFQQARMALPEVLATLALGLETEDAPTLYVGSVAIETWLPGFRQHNDFGFGALQPLASIWLGNRSRIPVHQDLPDNIACVVAGRRRVTLFPPDQLRNLYIGPLDRTPAGQAISLVDLAAPDLQRFPRFAEAMRHARSAVLEPGDAVLIPSMWWHHMEGLEDFNALVNYWWRQSPPWMDTPMNALMLALLTLRDLPPTQRDIWRDVFQHYVFDAAHETAAHIPESARGVLGPMDDAQARTLRARLLQRLNR